MIYEYPEEFVVPVIFTKELNPTYRDWGIEYAQIDKLIVPFIKSKEDKNFYINKNENSKDIYFYSFSNSENTDNKKICCNNLIGDYSDDENTKYILSDIDDEYAYMETLRI